MPFLEKVGTLPHTLSPDRLAKAPKKPVVEAVADKRVLTDGTQTLELYHLQGSNHTDTMLLGYLPKQKVLIEADVYNPTPGFNNLNNKMLFSGGVGLDIVTIYDVSIKLDWSFNQLGQNGIYLHRTNNF